MLAGGPAIRQRDDKHAFLRDRSRVDRIARKCVSRGQTPSLVTLPLEPRTFQKANARLGAAPHAESPKLFQSVVTVHALAGFINVNGGGVEARGCAPIDKLATEADVADGVGVLVVTPLEDAQDSRISQLVVSEFV